MSKINSGQTRAAGNPERKPSSSSKPTWLSRQLPAGSGLRRYDRKPLFWSLFAGLAIFFLTCLVYSDTVKYIAIASAEGYPRLVLDGLKHDWKRIRLTGESIFIPSAPMKSSLTTINLTLPDNALHGMHQARKTGKPELGHEPGGNKPYFKGSIQVGNGRIQRASVCFRGTMPWHHEAKPSFRVRLKKADIDGSDRFIELTRAEDSLAMRNWLPMQLASQLELFQDLSEHVRLFVNNKYFGVYIRTMRPSEALAIANHRLPGTFFKGDFDENLWESVSAWNISGKDDLESKEVFQRFIDILKKPVNEEAMQELSQIFDFETYARWAALMAVTGSTHTDYRHNQIYYFCPERGKIEAVPWDCNSFGSHVRADFHVDVVRDPLMNFMTCNAVWVNRRNQIIDEMIHGIASPDKLKSIIEKQYAILQPDLAADRNLGNIAYTALDWRMLPVSTLDLEKEKAILLDWIENRHVYLEKYLGDARISLSRQGMLESLRGDKIKIISSGSAAARNSEKPVNMFYPGLSRTLHSLEGVPCADWLPSPESRHEPNPAMPRSYLDYVRIACLLPVPMAYEISEQPTGDFQNAITGKKLQVKEQVYEPVDWQAQHKESRTLYTVSSEVSFKNRVIRLGPGVVNLDENLCIDKNELLEIAPGTTIKLGKDVGIYCAGVLRCLGRPESPISFEKKEESPWACLALYDAGSAGSVIECTSFSGGSLGRLQARIFKGMLTIYNCPDLVIRGSTFRNSYLGDDAVNISESVFSLEDCHFSDLPSDGLDCNLSTGKISRCRFRDIGDDAIDLMGSKAVISDCKIERAGDKGISIGEGSEVESSDLSIEECAIGAIVKDSSWARFLDTGLKANKVGLSTYRKKSFYSGETMARLQNCTLDNKYIDLHPQSRTVIELVATNAGRVRGKKTRFRLDSASSIDFVDRLDSPVLPNE